MADVFDITPGLIERVDEYYRARCMANASLPRLAKKLEEGKATYDDAYKYAEAIGKARADAFAHEVSSDVLPDGRMYYNIADRLMTETLSADHEVVADYAAGVQELVNKRDGISLAAQTADLDEDRIKGFVEGICNAEVYDDVAWKLGEPVVTHARTVVDDTVKKNAEFQGRAGVKATVIRNGTSKCCEWCSDLAGDYTYPNVPREVFQRHDNCKCTVDYEGRRLTSYNSGGSSHSFRDQGEQERIEQRRKYAGEVENNNKTAIIKSDVVSEKSKGHRTHTEKYGDEAILVNEKYISSDEYSSKFTGITGNPDVDNSICEISRGVLRDRSGTKKETLVLIDKSTGQSFLTIHSNEDSGITYSDDDAKTIAEAKKNGVDIIALHNHPAGYPPTADDSVSALLKEYDLGITSGHNGTVHVYYPSQFYYTKEECDEIHSIINEDCKYKDSIDDVLAIWKETLAEFGMIVKERR